MKIYIAGPMTGIVDHNFPAFHMAASRLRVLGHEVVNPAELDEGEAMDHPWDYYLRRDLKKLVECEAMAVLPGWDHSRGAQLEIFVGFTLGMKILDHIQLKPLSIAYTEATMRERIAAMAPPEPVTASKESVLQEAQRLVGGDRGAAYGHPADDMGRTGKIWAAILGIPEVTAAQVALCMQGVKISREVNSPKRDNRVDGPGYWLCLDMIREREAGK